MNEDIAIVRDEDSYEVWCGVDGITDKSVNIVNAHIIGTGETRSAAVAAAVEHLESVLDALQSPPGVVREVDVRRAPAEASA